MKTIELTFKPQKVTHNLLSVLPDRNREILVGRHGLENAKRMTLEAIGKRYGITRERVRQIENFALDSIKKSDVYRNEYNAITELRDRMHELGAIVPEDSFFELLAADERTRNHLNLLLVLGDEFEKRREDQHFRHRWSVDEQMSQTVHQALHTLYQALSRDDLVPEDEILERLRNSIKNEMPREYVEQNDVLRRWLNLSKVIGRNALGEWGLISSPAISARGVRDYAYLVIRRHGSPLHFTEVAKQITEHFGRKAHTATCHNELIKDKNRFVLVGRGLYGLTEWGYANGVVRDVVKNLLQNHGPLSREEIVDKVLKERHVKENTVAVNLQNRKHFKRLPDGRYTLVS